MMRYKEKKAEDNIEEKLKKNKRRTSTKETKKEMLNEK